MNDEDLPQIVLRASAYLDGELDPAETRRAEGDPALMAEVSELRALRAALRDVEPPSAAAREAALTAALGEFDRRHRPSTVVPFRPRPAYGRWLGVAAAVVAVGVLGVVISQSSPGGDDDDAGDMAAVQSDSAQPDSVQAELGQAESGQAIPEAAEEFDAAPDEDAARATSDSAAATPMLAEAPAATEAAAGADAELAAEATSAPAPTSTASATVAELIRDPAELTRTAQRLLELEAAGMLGPPPDTACGSDPDAPLAVLGEGTLIVGETPAPVLIAVDRATSEAFALDPDTCAVLTTGANP